jgi:hypothetical protein
MYLAQVSPVCRVLGALILEELAPRLVDRTERFVGLHVRDKA